MVEEKELIVKSKQGDKKSFGELVLMFQNKIYNHCRRIILHEEDAFDCSQEAFIKAWFGLKRFDEKRPFLPWLYRISTNCCYDFLRKKKYALRLEEDWGVASGAKGQEEEVIEQQQIRKIKKLILKLPAGQRAAISLFYFEEMKYKEIAEILRLPLNTVRTWIKRGRDHLRRAIKEER